MRRTSIWQKAIWPLLLWTLWLPTLVHAGNDMERTDQRPINWQVPDYRQFEFTMSLQVQLGDTLVNFQSKQDLMCVTINNEVRAVAGPGSTLGEVYYPLTIAGNGSEGAMTLNYYCDSLHRIYTIPNWGTFNPSIAPSGDSDIYRPKFTDFVVE